MSDMLVLIAVSTLLFSIYWCFFPRITSWKLLAIGLIMTGLGGVVYAFIVNDSFNVAILRFIGTDMGYLIGYGIIKIAIPKLIHGNKSKQEEQYKTTRSGFGDEQLLVVGDQEKPKRKRQETTFFEFDGQLFPIVDDEEPRDINS